MICNTDLKKTISLLECMADVIRRHSKNTREINQAVKNNPDKFPDGYILVQSIFSGGCRQVVILNKKRYL